MPVMAQPPRHNKKAPVKTGAFLKFYSQSVIRDEKSLLSGRSNHIVMRCAAIVGKMVEIKDSLPIRKTRID